MIDQITDGALVNSLPEHKYLTPEISLFSLFQRCKACLTTGVFYMQYPDVEDRPSCNYNILMLWENDHFILQCKLHLSEAPTCTSAYKCFLSPESWPYWTPKDKSVLCTEPKPKVKNSRLLTQTYVITLIMEFPAQLKNVFSRKWLLLTNKK